MARRPPRPPLLKLLCGLFVLWSGLTLALNSYTWPIIAPTEDGGTHYTYPLDLGVLGFIAAFGLWRYSSAGRKFAVLLTWYWLLGAAEVYLQYHPSPHFTITSGGHLLDPVPESLQRLLVVPVFFILVGQLYALKRATFRSLFEPPALPSNSSLPYETR